jgi:UDP-2-acetamido-2,6-beta-L-arabino-hexul-4-ose reductase
MFSKPYEYLKLQDYPDNRGNLFEILRFKDQGVPGEGQIYCFTILPGVRRGDHYHTSKREWASCVSGNVSVLVEDKDGNKEKILMDSKVPSVVYFHPYTTHAFLNEDDKESVIVSYSSKQLDKANPDTISKVIKYEEIQ